LKSTVDASTTTKMHSVLQTPEPSCPDRLHSCLHSQAHGWICKESRFGFRENPGSVIDKTPFNPSAMTSVAFSIPKSAFKPYSNAFSFTFNFHPKKQKSILTFDKQHVIIDLVLCAMMEVNHERSDRKTAGNCPVHRELF